MSVSVTARLPLFARAYHLTPRDMWALTLEQFFVFCEDHEASVAQQPN